MQNVIKLKQTIKKQPKKKRYTKTQLARCATVLERAGIILTPEQSRLVRLGGKK